jgi:endonuclease/exonuclease/phosphatase family metal-dependent hydrolase
LALIESPSLGVVLNPETGEVSAVGDSIIFGDNEFALTAVPGDMPREEYVSKINEKAAEISEIESITDQSASDEEVRITVKLKEGSNAQEVVNRLLSDFVSLSAVAANQSGAPGEYHPYPGHYVKRGDRGEEDKWVQKALQITADGIFGPKTEAAVKNFQKIKGVQADGIVGPVTWKLLFGEEDNSTPPGGNISKANLTVATWNIGRGSKVSGVTAAKLAAKIKDNGIDIIGMQEAKKNGSSFVGQIAGANNMSYYFTDTPAGNAILGKAGLTGKNYYTLVSCGERRALQKTVINVEGIDISFYNVHISYQNECRKKQITDVYNKVKNDPNPVILVGDFNVATNCGLIRDVFGSGYSIVSKDTVNTGIACTDSIVVSTKYISVKSSKTVKTKGSLSDHNMVIATLEIKK